MSVYKKNVGRQPEAQVNDGIVERLVRRFLEMQETDYMRIVVIPALEQEGYKYVDYHHGNTEIGKDLIFTRDAGFGKKDLFVAVVKADRLTKSASSSNGFPTVVNQLNQAIHNEVPSWDGVRRKPDGVFVILADDPSRDVLTSNIGGFDNLIQSKIRFVLGSEIAESILRNRKDIVEQILETSINVSSYLDCNPTNEPLLLALNSADPVEMASIFMELDASVGSVRMREALTRRAATELSPIRVKADRWKSVAAAVVALEKCLGSVLAISLTQSEKDYEKERARALSEDNVKLFEYLQKECDSLTAWVRNAKSEFLPSPLTFQTVDKSNVCAESDFAKIYERVSELFDECGRLGETVDFDSVSLVDESDYLVLLRAVFDVISSFSSSVAVICEKSSEIERVVRGCRILVVSPNRLIVREHFNDVVVKLCRSLKRYSSDANHLLRTRSQLMSRAGALIGEPDYSLNVSSDKLNDCFNEAKSRLLSLFRRNRSEVPNGAKALLDEARSFLYALNAINEIPELTPLFVSKVEDGGGVGGINGCVLDLLDSGEDILVVGNAGSGKSTTLEMFARRAFSKKDVGEEIIFLPLAKLSSVECLEFSGRKTIDYFSEEAAKLLRSSKPGVTKAVVKSAMAESKKIRFVVDGIDEALWIVPLLRDFFVEMKKEKGCGFQLVASSRFSVVELECLNLFSLELLPFGKDQVDQFVLNYLRRQPELAEKVLCHVKGNPDMYSIAQTPLMSTILCTLAQHGVALPHTRIALYKERFDLLWGAYDSRKAISRVKSTRACLEDVSKKLAYYLHSHRIRSEGREVLLDYILTTLVNRYESSKIELALAELIQPCNVVVKDLDGSLGFGHLTYQEYLASDELYTNRQGDMAIHLSDPWWREVLVLAAIRSDDIGDLISNRIQDFGLIGSAYGTLQAMINATSGTQRRTLMQLLEMHSLRDEWVDDAED